MPKATETNTISQPDFSTTIGQLKEIATASGDSLLLGDGPPHPDWELLGLTAEILRLARIAEQNRQSAWAIFTARPGTHMNQNERAEYDAFHQQVQEAEKEAKPLIAKARKLPITTPAGLYAVALITRTRRTASAEFGKKLADALINLPDLRASLWPANSGVSQ